MNTSILHFLISMCPHLHRSKYIGIYDIYSNKCASFLCHLGKGNFLFCISKNRVASLYESFILYFFQRNHQTLLRPTLGHPNNQHEFTKLMNAETSRQTDANEMVISYESSMSEAELKNAEEFLYDLQNYVTLLMSQFDTLVTVDDIIEGG